MQLTNLRHGAPGSNTILATVTDKFGVRDAVLCNDGSKSWYCEAYAEAIAGKHGPVAAYAPPIVDPALVKAEANRRILAIAPEWKQRNMIARTVEIMDVAKSSRTVEQKAELDAISGIWSQIKAVRERSNTIEEMNPIPADFADDKHWL